MSLVNREIYSIADDLTTLLSQLKNTQRGIIDNEPSGIFSHNWVYRFDDEIFITAISKKYSGGNWFPQDVEFKNLTSENFKDEFVTSGIPLGESGQSTLTGTFTAVSIVGALNELKLGTATGEWDRIAIDGSHEYVAPKDHTAFYTYVHVVSGLTDNFISSPIRLADNMETALNSNFPEQSSIIGAFNYLEAQTGGLPNGIDGSNQYKDGLNFAGTNKWLYDDEANHVTLHHDDPEDNAYIHMLAANEVFTLGIRDGNDYLQFFVDSTEMELMADSDKDFKIYQAGNGNIIIDGNEELALIGDKITIENDDVKRNLFESVAIKGGVFEFKTSTSTPPVTGEIRYNNTTQHSATIIYINKTDLLSVSQDSLLDSLIVGDLFYIYDLQNTRQYDEWLITAITEETAYFAFTVTLHAANGVIFVDEERIGLYISGKKLATSSGGGGVPKVLQVVMSDNQSLGTGSTFQLIEFDDIWTDETDSGEGDNWDDTNFIYTVPADTSKIQINVHAEVALGYSGKVTIRAYKNDSILAYGTQSRYYSGDVNVNINEITKVEEDDEIKIHIKHDSGYLSQVNTTYSKLVISRWED
ncbi:MAG: hypothetical protein ACTSXT_13750 [Candidatus Helarchaeota archaeon]